MKKIITCRTLQGSKNIDFSISCLKSLIENSFHIIKLQIFEDGTLKLSDIDKLESSLHGCTVIRKLERDDVISKMLLLHPNCVRLRKHNVFGFKILDTMLYDENDFFYVDTDIYFLKKFRLPDFTGFPIFMKDLQNGYNFTPAEFLGVKSPISPLINAGFYYFPKKLFNLDYIEEILQKYYNNAKISHWWAEQTLWAYLAANAGNTCYFNSKQIVMSTHNLKLDEENIAVHLVSSSRYQFDNVKKFAAKHLIRIDRYETIKLIKIQKQLTKMNFTFEWLGRKSNSLYKKLKQVKTKF